MNIWKNNRLLTCRGHEEEKCEKGYDERYFGGNRVHIADCGDGGTGLLAAVQY